MSIIYHVWHALLLYWCIDFGKFMWSFVSNKCGMFIGAMSKPTPLVQISPGGGGMGRKYLGWLWSAWPSWTLAARGKQLVASSIILQLGHCPTVTCWWQTEERINSIISINNMCIAVIALRDVPNEWFLNNTSAQRQWMNNAQYLCVAIKLK